MNAKQLLLAIWSERILIALLANLSALIFIANLVIHKDVEVSGGISSEEMSDIWAKGVNVNVSKIADQDLTFNALTSDNGYSLCIKGTVPSASGTNPLFVKPMPDMRINWGYMHPDAQ